MLLLVPSRPNATRWILHVILLVVVMILLVIGTAGCSSESSGPQLSEPESESESELAETESESEPILLDERTAILPAQTDFYGDGDVREGGITPSDDAVAAVLATVDTEPELAWARSHARFVSAYQSEEGEVIIVDFTCSAPALRSPGQALIEVQNLMTVGDGGDCFGSAFFTPDGTLLNWRTNGEA